LGNQHIYMGLENIAIPDCFNQDLWAV